MRCHRDQLQDCARRWLNGPVELVGYCRIPNAERVPMPSERLVPILGHHAAMAAASRPANRSCPDPVLSRPFRYLLNAVENGGGVTLDTLRRRESRRFGRTAITAVGALLRPMRGRSKDASKPT